MRSNGVGPINTNDFPLIVHCHLCWDWVWQRPQQFLSRLSQRHKILFVETVGPDPHLAAPYARFRSADGFPNITLLRIQFPTWQWAHGDLVDAQAELPGVEFASIECGLRDADSTEFTEETPFPIIFKLRDLVNVEELGGTMRLGAWDCRLKEGSLAQDVYHGAETISERHRHRFEFNPEFRSVLEKEGLIFSGVSPDGKFVEMVELPKDKHPYFIGCQFHPEYKSKPLDPHPLFVSFVKAAWENRLRSENLEHDVTADKQRELPERAESTAE